MKPSIRTKVGESKEIEKGDFDRRIIAQRGTGEHIEYLVQTRGNGNSATSDCWEAKDEIDHAVLKEYRTRYTAQGKPRKRVRQTIQDDDPDWSGE